MTTYSGQAVVISSHIECGGWKILATAHGAVLFTRGVQQMNAEVVTSSPSQGNHCKNFIMDIFTPSPNTPRPKYARLDKANATAHLDQDRKRSKLWHPVFWHGTVLLTFTIKSQGAKLEGAKNFTGCNSGQEGDVCAKKERRTLSQTRESKASVSTHYNLNQ